MQCQGYQKFHQELRTPAGGPVSGTGNNERVERNEENGRFATQILLYHERSVGAGGQKGEPTSVREVFQSKMRRVDATR